MINVYYINTASLMEDRVFESFYGLLSPERRKKTDALRRREDKARSLGAGLLLRAGFSRLGINAEDEIFLVSEGGKPYLAHRDGLFFNLAHSGDRAMCVISDVEVGCDVELIGGGNERVAKRFFTEIENQWLETCEDKASGFARIWTLRESVVKATGRGIAASLGGFSIGFRGESAYVLGGDDMERKIALREYFRDDSHAYAVARVDGGVLPDMEEISLDIFR